MKEFVLLEKLSALLVAVFVGWVLWACEQQIASGEGAAVSEVTGDTAAVITVTLQVEGMT